MSLTQLVLAARNDVLRQVREDRADVVAVGCGDVASTSFRLQTVLPHQSSDLLMFDDEALLTECRANATVAVELKLVADCEKRLNNRGVIGAFSGRS
jgi:hypothetical protein